MSTGETQAEQSYNRQSRDEMREIAWEMTTSVLTFDPAQKNPTTGDDVAATCFHLMSSTRAWVLPRPQMRSLARELRQAARVVLHGETGSGKTTIIRALRDHQIVGSHDQHLAIFDFNNGALALNSRHDNHVEALKSYILVGLEDSLEGTSYGEMVHLRWDALAAREALEFSAFRSKFRRDTGLNFRNVQSHELKEILHANAGLSSAHGAALDDFHSRAAGVRLAYLVKAIAESKLLALCFDNIDPLEAELRVTLAKIAQELAISTQARVGVVVACRSEHVSAVSTELDTGTVVTIPVESLKTGPQGVWDIGQIVHRRLDLLGEQSELYNSVASRVGTKFRPEFRSATDGIIAQFKLLVDELYEQTEPDRAADRLAFSLARWTNEDIRSTIVALNELVDQESMVDGLLAGNTQLIKDRLVHAFYRHLATGGGEGGVRNCLDFFQAKNTESTAEHRPFYFLRFRLLSHVHHLRTEQEVTVSSVIALFERDFGIAAPDVRKGLNWLAQREGMNSGYIRLESQNGKAVALKGSVDEDIHTTVKLLPAGGYFYSQLVSRVEYLFWLSIDLLNYQGATSLGEVGGRSSNWVDRVGGATLLLQDWMLPRFLEEHPYMDSSFNASPRDAQRLAKFRRAFGYTDGRWFIGRLLASVSGYMRHEIDHEQTAQRFEGVTSEIDAYVKRLSFVESLSE